MTEPVQQPPKPTGITISRSALMIAAAVLLVLLIGGAVAVGIAIGAASGNQGAPAAPPASSEDDVEPVQPAPAAEPEPDVFALGQTFTTGNVTLTVHSVEAVDSIATTQGSPITPDPGGQLFLVKMTYSNSKTQADLSCGNTDLYLQMFDSQEREMAPVFELYRIPGNPGCNDHLLQDTAHEWNYVFQSIAGAAPLAMSVTETDSWLDPVWVDVQ